MNTISDLLDESLEGTLTLVLPDNDARVQDGDYIYVTHGGEMIYATTTTMILYQNMEEFIEKRAELGQLFGASTAEAKAAITSAVDVALEDGIGFLQLAKNT